MAYDFHYWFDELVNLKKAEGDKNFEDQTFVDKERKKWLKGKFTDLVETVTQLRKAEKKDESEIPSFKDYVQKVRLEETFIDIPLFAEYYGSKFSNNIPYLNEAENAEVDKWVKEFEDLHGNDLSKLDENFLTKIVGGAAGFVLGPTIGRIIANALGIDRGVLYDMFTSRVVSAALGVAIAKGVGGEYKPH
jgi:hypothetical protein